MAKQNKTLELLIGLILITFGLWYIFFSLDIIPDAVPWIGFVDDALIIVIGIWLFWRFRKNIKKTQGR